MMLTLDFKDFNWSEDADSMSGTAHVEGGGLVSARAHADGRFSATLWIGEDYSVSSDGVETADLEIAREAAEGLTYELVQEFNAATAPEPPRYVWEATPSGFVAETDDVLLRVFYAGSGVWAYEVTA